MDKPKQDYKILEEMEEILQGECIADYITKQEMMDTIIDVQNWLKTAKPGENYHYSGYTFTLANPINDNKNNEDEDEE